MECVLALPAPKEGNVVQVNGKNKEEKGIGSDKSCNGRKKTSKMHQNFRNDYGMECVLALPAPKEGNVVQVNGKSKEEKGIGSYKSSNGRKKTSKMHQKVQNFRNDYGKKGVSDLIYYDAFFCNA